MAEQMMTRAELIKALEGAEWVFARTMPWCPHEYTLRKTWADDGRFVAAVEAIRALGEVRPWKRYRHTYFDANGWTYWTMGSPIPATILINRAKLAT